MMREVSVSILVLVDVPLEASPGIRSDGQRDVSILVLVDVPLEGRLILPIFVKFQFKCGDFFT